MAHYLFSFPSSALSETSAEDFAGLVETSHQAIREAKAEGVYVFGGGINDSVSPVRVSADGTTSSKTYSESRQLDGGFCILNLPTRQEAEHWAVKLAAACGCDQELREFHEDPES